jgi:alginate O-acetyltransferase complex protein AlgI
VASQLVQRVITREGFADGARRFIIGLAKKMMIANIVAEPADAIFKLPSSELTAGLAWLGIVCYTLQIYFDFSGYSDMAIGLAKLFGFRFRENFQYPYIARSITEFWRRWHISLSSWYRDYLYIPLGGSRGGSLRTYFNLVIVFFLCGLWHGATWTFVGWGLFHGSFLVAERLGVGRWLERAWAPVRHGYTLAVVMAGWVFFKAATFAQATAFFGALVGLGRGAGMQFHTGLYVNAPLIAALACGIVGSLPLVPYLIEVRDRWLAGTVDGGAGRLLEPALALAPVAVQGVLLLVSGMLLAGGTYNPFIYFRF